MRQFIGLFLLGCCIFFHGATQVQAALNKEDMAPYVVPPMELGEKDEHLPVWHVLNSGGALAGYIFESRDLAPIPGFSGTPMNLLITIDLEGNFIDVTVLDQNEPVFVSGLGPRPLFEFLQQYRGLSLTTNIKVGSVQGKAEKNISNSVQIDGVTKATASVRIANQSILASALKVARQNLANIAPKPVSYPDKSKFEDLSWDALIEKGLIKHKRFSNADVEALFAETDFAGLDDITLEDPDGLYGEFWVADLGLPSVMKNIMSVENQRDLNNQLSPFEEPILILANGRHQLVLDNFVRNTVPDRLGAKQNGFFVNMRDADIDVSLKPGLADFDQAMVFRLDTRLGFDPSSPWEFIIKTARQKGMFRPTVELKDLTLPISYPAEYFLNEEDTSDDAPMWLKSWQDQQVNLIITAVFLIAFFILLARQKPLLAHLKTKRLAALLFTLVFIGWFAQGQLSMVTVIAFFKAVMEGQNLSFLLFDPISLLVWGFVFVSFFIWGRGTFCGWLCPFGVLQELSNHVAKLLGLKQISLSPRLTTHLEKIKYLILAALLLSGIFLPDLSDKLVELEPFKTAITMQFVRDLPYVAYAVFWLILGLFYFKPYCRFICPLGAFMIMGGKLRLTKWIKRRKACGSPCQLCHVRCDYGAIDKSNGQIKYSACFQCLDCVEIFENDQKCVPLILTAKKGTSHRG